MKQVDAKRKVSTILSLQISSLGVNDRLIWKHNPNRQFSINSGYKISREQMNREKGGEGSSTIVDDERKLWGKIWSLNIKRKAQHFLWRACNNCISVRACLKKGGIKTDGMCKQCREGLETVEHLFFYCPKTQLIWKISPVSWEGLSYATDSFKA